MFLKLGNFYFSSKANVLTHNLLFNQLGQQQHQQTIVFLEATMLCTMHWPNNCL